MRAPRWRCADPHCWAYRWQTVLTLGEYDDLDVALEELEAHECGATRRRKKAA